MDGGKFFNLKSKIRAYGFVSLALTLILFSCSTTRAAVFSFSSPGNAAPGQLFEISAFLNTEHQSINAIEGNVVLPPGILNVERINYGNSIVNFWLESPHIVSGNQISFSGVIPGGYTGAKGRLFSFIVESDSGTSSSISMNGIKAFLNDGRGTPAKVGLIPFSFTISQFIQNDNLVSMPKDVLPDPFVPIIDSNPLVFQGQWVLIFSTQDKGLGIDHYEVKEGSENFTVAKSPYLLKYQELDKNITVKAVNKAGRSRIVVIPAPHPQKWYELYSIWIIMIILVAGIGFLKKRHDDNSSIKSA